MKYVFELNEEEITRALFDFVCKRENFLDRIGEGTKVRIESEFGVSGGLFEEHHTNSATVKIEVK